MGDNERKNVNSAAGCYLPGIGILLSIYNLFTDKKNDTYCRFHSYHSLFLWITIAGIIMGINMLAFIVSYLPFIGPFLVNITSIALSLLYAGVIVYGIFCSYNTYQGISFSIPYITEWTNKYLEEKKMLP
jgi:uncharacterized membrane protein